MNVNIRCLKYELKTVQSRALELEKSKIQNYQFNEISHKIYYLNSKVKHLKSDFKKIREEKNTKNEEMNKYEKKLNDIHNPPSYACEKANQEISLFQDEIILQDDKIILIKLNLK